MFDRAYFEAVLPAQIRKVSRSVSVKLRLYAGVEYDVWKVREVHDGFVVLEVHSGGDEPERTPEWIQAHPNDLKWIFDQTTIPYEAIAEVYISAKPSGSDRGRPIGFHHDAV